MNRCLDVIGILFPFVFMSCGLNSKSEKKSEEQPQVMVSIEPLRYFTEAVADNHVKVLTMVPKGSSPEHYDPTPRQLIDLSESKAYLGVPHLGFELGWMNKFKDQAPSTSYFDLSKGINLIKEESCGLSHHHHHGGVEPHVWTSPYEAQFVVENIAQALVEIDPEHAACYQHKKDSMIQVLQITDSLTKERLHESNKMRSFMIYHPSLSYFARRYGLHQLAIEEGGREPSPAHLKNLIDKGLQEQVQIIFVQPEFDRKHAELVGRQLNAKVVGINPLSYNWAKEMEHIVNNLIEKESQE